MRQQVMSLIYIIVILVLVFGGFYLGKYLGEGHWGWSMSSYNTGWFFGSVVVLLAKLVDRIYIKKMNKDDK